MKKTIPDRTRASAGRDCQKSHRPYLTQWAASAKSRRNCTNPLGIGAHAIFFALILMAPSVLQAAPPVETYSELLTAIRGVRAESQARVEKAVEQEKVREAWETGKLIDEHVLHHQERADYGAKVLERLSNDLGVSHTELKYMLQFARAYPISRPADQLSWSHYEALLAVNDAKERQAGNLPCHSSLCRAVQRAIRPRPRIFKLPEPRRCFFEAMAPGDRQEFWRTTRGYSQ